MESRLAVGESPFPPLKLGPLAKCPKCGGDEVSVYWHDEREISDDTYNGHERGRCRMVSGVYCKPGLKKRHTWVPEHMHRGCRRCTYEWAEAPLT